MFSTPFKNASAENTFPSHSFWRDAPTMTLSLRELGSSLPRMTVALPEALRSKLRSGAASGLLVVHVEQAGPADKAEILLGDILVELQGQPLEGMDKRATAAGVRRSWRQSPYGCPARRISRTVDHHTRR